MQLEDDFNKHNWWFIGIAGYLISLSLLCINKDEHRNAHANFYILIQRFVRTKSFKENTLFSKPH